MKMHVAHVRTKNNMILQSNNSKQTQPQALCMCLLLSVCVFVRAGTVGMCVPVCAKVFTSALVTT